MTLEVQTPDICIYHGHCPDGFTSAWAVWKRFGDDVDFRHGSYGSPPPSFVEGKHILMVDFSFSKEVMEDLVAKAASVTILDHHVTAKAYIQPMIESGLVKGVFDMERSGAGITWDVLHPGVKRPTLINVIEDRDLWRWKFGDDTRFLCMFIDTWAMTFENWDLAADQLQFDYPEAMKIGGALYQKHMKNCDSLIGATLHHIQIGEFRVPCCNVPHIYCSEVGNILARREDAPFSATFFINKDGAHAFSLRSLDDKEDVSKIASTFGGGGHRNAAGFRRNPGDYFPIIP